MPSPGNHAYVEPSLLASIVRKNELLSIPQLVDSIVTLGQPSRGLSSKVRASLTKVLASQQYGCARIDAVAHPAATTSCRLVWSSGDGPSADIPFRLDELIRSDWRRHDRRGCCLQSVVFHTALTHVMRDQLNDSRINSAKLLRTRLWLDLLKKDPKAARSWRVCGPDMWSPAESWPAATYQNSKSQTVFAVVPNGELHNIQFCLEIAKTFTAEKGWVLEVYSLSFPALNHRRQKHPHSYSIDWMLDDTVFD